MDDLRARDADKLLHLVTVALHGLDCDPNCRECVTTMDRYGRQAQAVLAAMDLDKVRDEGREQGRREAATGIAAKLEAAHLEQRGTTWDSLRHGAAIARGFVGEERGDGQR